ncbi:Reticulocyte-binding protein 2 a [Amphibalanus amphitrite]|uniref:Reticulocyte-binding protein 2 a n=1 Tax=Amphibalanus amphitrite TaxID=1232801 RepID=A0A6A4WRH5_AMPAM|nr:Reticulocyte-binding protein 2 a [Amphibalanus amphitrite]
MAYEPFRRRYEWVSNPERIPGHSASAARPAGAAAEPPTADETAADTPAADTPAVDGAEGGPSEPGKDAPKVDRPAVPEDVAAPAGLPESPSSAPSVRGVKEVAAARADEQRTPVAAGAGEERVSAAAGAGGDGAREPTPEPAAEPVTEPVSAAAAPPAGREPVWPPPAVELAELALFFDGAPAGVGRRGEPLPCYPGFSGTDPGAMARYHHWPQELLADQRWLDEYHGLLKVMKHDYEKLKDEEVEGAKGAFLFAQYRFLAMSWMRAQEVKRKMMGEGSMEAVLGTDSESATREDTHRPTESPPPDPATEVRESSPSPPKRAAFVVDLGLLDLGRGPPAAEQPPPQQRTLAEDPWPLPGRAALPAPIQRPARRPDPPAAAAEPWSFEEQRPAQQLRSLPEENQKHQVNSMQHDLAAYALRRGSQPEERRSEQLLYEEQRRRQLQEEQQLLRRQLQLNEQLHRELQLPNQQAQAQIQREQQIHLQQMQALEQQHVFQEQRRFQEQQRLQEQQQQLVFQQGPEFRPVGPAAMEREVERRQQRAVLLSEQRRREELWREEALRQGALQLAANRLPPPPHHQQQQPYHQQQQQLPEGAWGGVDHQLWRIPPPQQLPQPEFQQAPRPEFQQPVQPEFQQPLQAEFQQPWRRSPDPRQPAADQAAFQQQQQQQLRQRFLGRPVLRARSPEQPEPGLPELLHQPPPPGGERRHYPPGF